MSDNDNKQPAVDYAPMDAVAALIRQVQKFDPTVQVEPPKGPVDLHAMHLADARRAAAEIKTQVEQQRAAYVRRMHDSGRIDGRWTFKTLRMDAYNQSAVLTAKGFCESKTRFDDQPVILLLQGFEGSGKTVLCSAIANYFLENSTNPSVEIINFDDLRQAHLFSSSEEKEERMQRNRLVEHYMSVNLLIIDSIIPTGEGLSMFDQKIFSNLLRTRLQRNLSMVISLSVPFTKLHASVGELCFESLKAYSVMTAELYGGSRRNQIMVNGVPLR